MTEQLTRINLGCGHDYKRSYMNIDSSPLVKPDYIIDLEEGKLPFPDNSVEEVLCYHVLEHIQNFIPLMKEIHRVCKPGAIIDIKCPFFSAWGQYNDPTHVRFFSTHTFDYFEKGNYSHEVDVDKDLFKTKVRINYAIGRLKFMNWIMNPLLNLWQDFYVRFFSFIIPASEIKYTLTILK